MLISNVRYHIFMNNYLTAFHFGLLYHLGVSNIRATGEVNKNGLLGHLEQCISSKKSSATLTVVGWNSKALQSFT